MEFIASLEKQISSQRSDLAMAGADMHAASAYRASLERRIEDLTRRADGPEATRTVTVPSSSSLQARCDEMEGIALELTHRAESAENSLKMLMGAEPVNVGAPSSGAPVADSAGHHWMNNPHDLSGMPSVQAVDVNCRRTSIDSLTDTSQHSLGDTSKRQSIPTEINDLNSRRSSMHSQSDSTHSNDVARNQTISVVFNDSNSRRCSIQSEADEALYNPTRSEVFAVDRDDESEHLVAQPYLLTTNKKRIVKKLKSKSAGSTPRTSIASAGSLMSTRTKKFELPVCALEGPDSKIAPKRAAHLQNLSLGSDHGYIIPSSHIIGTKVIAQKDTVRRATNGANGSSAKNAVKAPRSTSRSTSAPMSVSRQNVEYLRMSDSVLSASSSRRPKATPAKTPIRSKKTETPSNVRDRTDASNGNAKFAHTGSRTGVTPRSALALAAKMPITLSSLSQQGPRHPRGTVLQDKKGGKKLQL